MKIKKFQDFSLNESFALSTEFWNFVRKNSIDWEKFEESLYDIRQIHNCFLNKNCGIADENGHWMNVSLEEDKKYRIVYSIGINFYRDDSMDIQDFVKTQEDLNTISISLQEMIDRVSTDLKLKKNEVKINKHDRQINFNFDVEFQSEILDNKELKNVYDNYLQTTSHTPEFNEGIKKLTEYYKRQGIELGKYLDTSSAGGTIMVGFLTEDDLYVIADYTISSKKFDIDYSEVESSIEWWMENN